MTDIPSLFSDLDKPLTPAQIRTWEEWHPGQSYAAYKAAQAKEPERFWDTVKQAAKGALKTVAEAGAAGKSPTQAAKELLTNPEFYASYGVPFSFGTWANGSRKRKRDRR